MKKADALKLYNNSCSELARSLGKTRAAVSAWPDELSEDQLNMWVGISYRLGRELPESVLIPDEEKEVWIRYTAQTRRRTHKKRNGKTDNQGK